MSFRDRWEETKVSVMGSGSVVVENTTGDVLGGQTKETKVN